MSSTFMKRLVPVLFVALLALRLPSLWQPAGSDQGLYAYMGQAIMRGEVPYRDAWDQKPPGVHVAYALMYAIWPADGVVAATDGLAAALAALLLVFLGRRLWGSRGPGEVAALLFLLLGNASFERLDGLYVRAQCETFIAVLAVAALLLLTPLPLEMHSPSEGARPMRRFRYFGAGLLLGLAFLFKYNAIIYVAAAVVTVLLLPAPPAGRRYGSSVTSRLALLAAGCAIPVVVVAACFSLAGAWQDLWQATVHYNMAYSGETYAGRLAFGIYLVTFPIQHARVDVLWLLGGAGCLVLVAAALGDRTRLVVPLWIGAACVSIAVNGSRGLPQYFVQALPLLALAAGLGGTLVWNALALVPRLALVAVIALATARVSPFETFVQNTWFDVQCARSAVSASVYIARFVSPRQSVADLRSLGDYLRANTAETDRVFVFGFSGGAYVRSRRTSASRFFWSRPILAGFNEGIAGYGANGLLRELSAHSPPIVALQMHDWPAEGIDSATYFLQHPQLGAWLRSGYALVSTNSSYQIWRRNK